MTITYKMRNVTPDLVKIVMLRKFFQMVFVGNDRKSLHIYTASVIGGTNTKEEAEGNQAKTKGNQAKTEYVSQLDSLKEFCMQFTFVVKGNDNNDVLSIVNSDITDDGDADFLSQVEYIKQVWGKECKVIYNNQTALNKKLKVFLGSTYESTDEGTDEGADESTHAHETAALASQKILFIQDEEKEQEKELLSLALHGQFDTTDYQQAGKRTKECKTQEGKEKASYRIRPPENLNLMKGIELVNWVKTTINFKYKVCDSNLNFCIHKDIKPNEKTTYIAPDFTWYFSPPVKSFINNGSSSVEVKSQAVESKAVTCKYMASCTSSNETQEAVNPPECSCPIRSGSENEHVTKRHPNVINPVANKTTVHFKRWTKHEMIGHRQKYRLAFKNIFTRNELFNAAREINIFLDTDDDHGRGNRQFVLSIFISFALAFGIDSSRLDAAKAFFPLPDLLTADAWWLMLLILIAMNLLIHPPRSEREHRFFVWRKANVIVSILWVIYVFIVSKSVWITSLYVQYIDTTYIVAQFCYAVLLISNVSYAFYNIKKYHDPIVFGMFNDYIL